MHLGTGLEVYPDNEIPRLARGKTVYINDDIDDITARIYGFDLIIEGKAKEVLEAIERYGQAFRDKEYRFCTYKMTLDKFLIQDNGYMDWLDEGQKWINYINFRNKAEERLEEIQKSKIRTKFHLAKSRGDKYTADELEELILNNQRKK